MRVDRAFSFIDLCGFTAFTESVTTDQGKLTRVRVGPVLDRAAADQLKSQIQSKTGVDGIVRPHP